MLTFAPMKHFIWRLDPGYFSLKQAAKTILSLLVSLWIIRQEPLLTKLLAGVASTVSMQGIVAKTWRTRALHVGIFTLIYFAVFVLGLSVRESPSLTGVTLVLLGFFANYIRRFGLESSLAPMMLWLLCFLATILPYTDEGWGPIYGLLVGFGVSAAVILCLFPDNYPRLYINNSNLFFATLGDGMNEIRRHLLMSEARRLGFSELSFVRIRFILMPLLAVNQAIQHHKVFANREQQVESVLTHQYALLNAYSLILDAYKELWMRPDGLSDTARLALSRSSKQFATLFSQMRVDSNYHIARTRSFCFIPNLTKRLRLKPATDADMVMILLNFKLGFDLLNQHAAELLRNTDET